MDKEKLDSLEFPSVGHPFINENHKDALKDACILLQEKFGNDWDWNKVKSNLENWSNDEEELKSLFAELEFGKDRSSLLNALISSVNQFKVQLEENSESPSDLIQEFYDSAEFEALYQKAAALKKGGERVTSKDIGELLQKGSDKEKALYALLVSDEHKDLSRTLWEKSEVRRKFKESFESQEVNDIAEFFKDLSDIPAEDQNDPKKLIIAFQKKFPNYQNKENEKWYLDKFSEQINKLKAPELKTLQDFYNSEDFKKLYNQVSANLGQAPLWSDIQKALTASGYEKIVTLSVKHKPESHAMWDAVWKKAKEEFESFEASEFDKFTDNLTAKDFADIDKVALDFQNTRKRFSGSKRLDWYKQKLEFKKRLKQSEWKDQMNQFYANQLPGIYAEVAREKSGAPEWQDIRAKLIQRGDTETLYILENLFKGESEGKWKAYWQNQKETFDSAENKTADEFLKKLSATALDNPSGIKAKFNNETEFSADNQWFENKLSAFLEAKKSEFENRHQALVSSLPDSALANAMHAGFTNAKTFAEREKWLQENQAKVAEYAPLINQNLEQEARLTAEAERHSDLKKNLSKIRADYAAGKNNYAAGVYSPRKYAEALNTLSTQLQEREALVDRTIDSVKQKSLRDVPDLPKKKTSFEEFRDALKKKKFYALDEKARKDERVRDQIKSKNQELYSQWQTAREQHLNIDTRTKVDKAKQTINRVKLPNKLPDNIQTPADFTMALKDAKVYAALSPAMMKNETVRQSARERNQAMWEQYQAQQAKKQTAEKELNPEANPKIEAAEQKIKSVKLDSALQLKLVAKLAGKDATDKNNFTVALRELNVYGGIDSSLWQNPQLREQAWQQNMELQKQFLARVDNAEEATNKTPENEAENNNFGLPGHYKINWDSLDRHVNESQKATAIERFKQMHNRSDIGLQTVMQQFHQPLGTFILETLAVMPKDKYDKALNALKDVRVEAGKREQASNWLKVLCENAGLGFLEKEASSAFSQLKQNFSTHFGTSLDKAWEDKDEITEVEKEAETSSEVQAETNTEADDKSEEATTSQTQSALSDEEELAELVDSASEEELETREDPPDENLESNEDNFETPDEAINLDESLDNLDAEAAEDVIEEAYETNFEAGFETDLQEESYEDFEAEESNIEDEFEAPENDEVITESETNTGSTETITLDEADLTINDTNLDDPEDIIEAGLLAEEEPDAAPNLETTEDSETRDENLDVVDNHVLDDTETSRDDLEDSDFEDSTETLDDDLETEDEIFEETENPDQNSKILDGEPNLIEDNDEEAEITETEEILDRDEPETEARDEEIAGEILEDPDTPIEIKAEAPVIVLETDDENDLDKTDTSDENLELIQEKAVDSENLAVESPKPDILENESIEGEGEIEREVNEEDSEEEVKEPETLEVEIQEDENKLEGVEEMPEPEVIPMVKIEHKEQEAGVHEALVAWKNFTETNLPLPVSQESADLKKQFSEILKTGLDEATIEKLKASGTWEKLMASPLHQQLLRTHLKQHQALSNEGLHFFTVLQQELFFSSSLTVNKFLEQLKSYIQFTKELKAQITTPLSNTELSKESAQALFNAFTKKFHSTPQIKSISLGFENGELRVTVSQPKTKSVWHFTNPELAEA